jgi:hypothetical protein
VNFSVKIHQKDDPALVEVAGHLTSFEVSALHDSVSPAAPRKNATIFS